MLEVVASVDRISAWSKFLRHTTNLLRAITACEMVERRILKSFARCLSYKRYAPIVTDTLQSAAIESKWVSDQEERYALVSKFVQQDDLPYTVSFDFLKEGIKIHGQWLPALKMDWLLGETLDEYIVNNLATPAKLGELLDKFVTMISELRRAGIAHGDLQHGNIIVCKNELRLVDYDGMFVPSMKGFLANELGHRNYQHPVRAADHFDPYLDNFSAWVIYASIRALQIDPGLLHRLGGGDDCLLF